MPLIHMEFKIAVGDAAAPSEWPLISAAAGHANRHSSKQEQQ
jgi:hypothetical protein